MRFASGRLAVREHFAVWNCVAVRVCDGLHLVNWLGITYAEPHAEHEWHTFVDAVSVGFWEPQSDTKSDLECERHPFSDRDAKSVPQRQRHSVCDPHAQSDAESHAEREWVAVVHAVSVGFWESESDSKSYLEY